MNFFSISLRRFLIFLDIKLKKATGFDLLTQLPSLKADVIFVTAYNEFALKAFDFFAFDYLLKLFIFLLNITRFTSLSDVEYDLKKFFFLLSKFRKNFLTADEIQMASQFFIPSKSVFWCRLAKRAEKKATQKYGGKLAL